MYLVRTLFQFQLLAAWDVRLKTVKVFFMKQFESIFASIYFHFEDYALSFLGYSYSAKPLFVSMILFYWALMITHIFYEKHVCKKHEAEIRQH